MTDVLGSGTLASSPLRPLLHPKQKISITPCRFFNFSCLTEEIYHIWCGRLSHIPCYRDEYRAYEGA